MISEETEERRAAAKLAQLADQLRQREIRQADPTRPLARQSNWIVENPAGKLKPERVRTRPSGVGQLSLAQPYSRTANWRMENLGTPKAGYVYVLTSDLLPVGVYKIGRTTDLVGRLHSHRTSLPMARYAHTVWAPDAEQLESALHRRFSIFREAGTEWFHGVDLTSILAGMGG